MDFLVHIENKYPMNADPAVRDDLVLRESRRAKELAEQGILKQLWRRPGRRANVGIWSSADASILHQALESLPFFPWLDIEVWPLAEHPNDPAKNGREK